MCTPRHVGLHASPEPQTLTTKKRERRSPKHQLPTHNAPPTHPPPLPPPLPPTKCPLPNPHPHSSPEAWFRPSYEPPRRPRPALHKHLVMAHLPLPPALPCHTGRLHPRNFQLPEILVVGGDEQSLRFTCEPHREGGAWGRDILQASDTVDLGEYRPAAWAH
jgi:hypothetical protein